MKNWLAILIGFVLPSSLFAADRPLDFAQIILDSGGFRGSIGHIDFSPDQNRLAVSGDQDVRIWRLSDGELLTTIRGERSHGGYGVVQCAVFSPNGRELVVGIEDDSDDGCLRVYDTSNFSVQRELLPKPVNSVFDLTFSLDGRYLAAADSSGEVTVWDWPRRSIISNKPPRSIESPVLHLLKFLRKSGSPQLLIHDQAGAALFDHNGNEQKNIPLSIVRMWGKMINGTNGAAGGYQFPSTPEPPFKFDVHDGRDVFVFAAKNKPTNQNWVAAYGAESTRKKSAYFGHLDTVTATAISGDGQLIASGDKHGEVHLWKTNSGVLVRKFVSRVTPITSAGWAKATAGLRLPAIRFGRGSSGKCDKEFDLNSRRLRTIGATTDYVSSSDRRDGVTINTRYDSDKEKNAAGFSFINSFRAGRAMATYRMDRDHITSLAAIAPASCGTSTPVIFADDYGGLACWDGTRTTHLLNRHFVGHSGKVNALSVAPDGKHFLSASDDGTIRIWSLQDHHFEGDLDCRLLNQRIIEISTTSESYRGGLRKGDMVRKMGAYDPVELGELSLQRKFPFLPGQTAPITIERNGVRLTKNVKLVAGADSVQPVVNLFVTDEDEWVMWTPEGYYDASLGGEQLIGWLENQGKNRNAAYYPVSQFRDLMYRPDIVSKVLAGQTVSDLRNLQDKKQFEANTPPVIRIVSTRKNSDGKLAIDLRCESMNGESLTEVEVFVENTRYEIPVSGKLVTHTFVADWNQSEANLEARGATVSGIVSAPALEKVVGTRRTASEPGVLHILAIGVGQYQDEQFEDLDYSVRDTGRFIEVAKSMGGLYTSVEPHLLTDENATQREIKKALSAFERKSLVGPNDTLVMFLSGHGVRDTNSVGDDYYFIPHDAEKGELGATAINWHDLQKTLTSVRAKRKVLFLDTCHAGRVTQEKDVLFELKAKHVLVFAGSRADESAKETELLKGSVFTSALVSALRSPSTDVNERKNVLDAVEIKKAIQKNMQVNGQTPQFLPLDMSAKDELFAL